MKDMTTLPTYFFFENDREDDIFHVEEDVVVLSKTILDRRMKLIENLVRRCRNSKSVESVVGLASDLRLSEDVVRVEAMLSLYCRGCDEEAETQFELVGHDLRQNMCKRLVPLARSRLRALFRVCLSSAKHSSILSAVDSSVSKKIMQEDSSRKNEDMKEVMLAMTCSLLRKMVSVLKDDEWVIDMTHAANDALEAATSQSLVLDTSRRRPRTGTKMFKRKTLKKKKKNTEKQKKVFPGRVPDFDDGSGDWV